MSKKILYIFSTIIILVLSILIWTFATLGHKPIILGGSTSVNSFMQKVTTSIKDVDYEYNSTGSQNGINGVRTNIYVAGFLSKNPDPGEWDVYSKQSSEMDKIDDAYVESYINEKINNSKGKSALSFGTDAIVMIYNPPDNNSENNELELTYDQIRQIYEGDITNWNQIEGQNYQSKKIIPYTRESGSGTRSSFEEKMNIKNESNASVANSNGMMYSSIETTNGSIGFVSLSFANKITNNSSIYLAATSSDGEKFSRVGYARDGNDKSEYIHIFDKNGKLIESDITNNKAIVEGSYDLTRPFVMIYKNKNINKLKKLLYFFVDNKKNKSIYEDEGLVFTFSDLNPTY